MKAPRSVRAALCVCVALCVTASVGCSLFKTGGRYGPRDKGCAVEKLASAPPAPFVDLGTVTIDCWAGNNDGCEQELLDEVCRRGGNVVWGLGDLAPSTDKVAVHVGRVASMAADAGN
jgi:hypothetical protein